MRESGCEDNVIAHCEAVSRLALEIARLCNARTPLVLAGAMLHDIGRCRTHSIRHAVEGAAIARELGLSEEVVNIIERHIGGGLSHEEAEALGLPPRDFIPQTLEEKIVAHADNLIDGTAKVSVKTAVGEFDRRGFGEAAKRVLALHAELSHVARKDLDEVRASRDASML